MATFQFLRIQHKYIQLKINLKALIRSKHSYNSRKHLNSTNIRYYNCSVSLPRSTGSQLFCSHLRCVCYIQWNKLGTRKSHYTARAPKLFPPWKGGFAGRVFNKSTNSSKFSHKRSASRFSFIIFLVKYNAVCFPVQCAHSHLADFLAK
jgi:hypothetical protein